MKRLLLFSVVLAFFSILPAAEENCDGDGSCKLPGTDSSGNCRVLSPVGFSSVNMIRQAPRLKTLSGKRIAIVGGSFMAYVTHPELKRLILKDYPDAKVYVLNEVGSAGPWPGPGVFRQQKEDFTGKLKELRIDAVISGNGGCGLCTPKEMGSCIAAEHLGIPSVMIAAPGFTEQAVVTAKNAGIPVPLTAEYPGAFSSHTREQLLENTRKVLYPQIISALTNPLPAAVNSQAEKGSPDGVIFTGTLDEVNHFFAENGWTDGLPVIPPTPERVAEFLKFTDLSPDSSLGEIPPARRTATPRLVAVNGVMSGCPPEFMPVLIAITKAMLDGDFRRTLASTHAWTPYCWINGPVSRQLGIDFSQGEISNRRNAVIGRFFNLAMLNLGGYHIKENRMGTFGYLMPWCLAEDEKLALELKWLPYHMQMGYGLNENTLTAASALSWGNNLAPATSDPVKIMELMAQDAVEKEQFALGSGTPFVYRTMLITGNVAKDLAAGYRTKKSLEDALVASARRPAADRAYANYWANPGSAFDPAKYPLRRHIEKIVRQENGKVTPVPPWLEWTGIDRIETVPVMIPGKTAILVTGDENRNKTMCLPGGGFTTVKIELPRKWDPLMEKLGYAPLSSFFLKSDLRPETSPRKFSNYNRERSGDRSPSGAGMRNQRSGSGRESGRTPRTSPYYRR